MTEEDGMAGELTEVGVVGLGTMGGHRRGAVPAGLAPAPLLEQPVTAGHLGRTAGRGFRDHPTP